ncbi:MAG: type II toxin-antitoxin system Phd/YefM family antitoxin [Novosphingobium sp.]
MEMTMLEETLSVTEFKAKCLQLFDRLEAKRLGKITVTRRGKPVAVVSGPLAAEDEARAVFGSMAGLTIIPDDVDLTAPVFDGEIVAEAGVLHL